eukprot:36935_1
MAASKEYKQTQILDQRMPHNYRASASCGIYGTYVMRYYIHPEAPIIKILDTNVKGQLTITISWKHNNPAPCTFCFEILFHQRHQNKKIRITTQDLRTKINNINTEHQCHVRVMAESILYKSVWSKWTGTSLPLHRFSIKNLCHKIEKWVHNDVKHKRMVEYTRNQFSGKTTAALCSVSSEEAHQEIKNIFIQFVTRDTMKIILNCFERCKSDIVKNSKNVSNIAEILCEFPVTELVKTIQENKIDGTSICEILEENIIFGVATGWSNEDNQQIKLMLFKHMSLKENQIINNINII